MRKSSRWLLLVSMFVLLLGGCATGRDDGRELLPRHPLTETRMSTQAEPGYLPSGVWRLRGKENTVYLAGTSHLVAEDQIPFPSPYYAAYQDAQEIYVEYDTHSKLAAARMVPKAMGWMWRHRADFYCPRGQKLTNYLKPETSTRLEALYGKKDFKKRQGYTPLFLLFMAEFESMSQGGEATSGVEDIFQHAAKKARKPLRTLDDNKVVNTAFLAMDEMLAELQRDLAKRGVDAVIAEHIFGDGAEPEEDLDRDWRRGDVPAIEKLQDDLKKESPAFYEAGLVDRNRKWMPAITRALNKKNNILILVGVAHIPGQDGLLELLRQAGYTAEQMYGLDRP